MFFAGVIAVPNLNQTNVSHSLMTPFKRIHFSFFIRMFLVGKMTKYGSLEWNELQDGDFIEIPLLETDYYTLQAEIPRHDGPYLFRHSIDFGGWSNAALLNEGEQPVFNFNQWFIYRMNPHNITFLFMDSSARVSKRHFLFRIDYSTGLKRTAVPTTDLAPEESPQPEGDNEAPISEGSAWVSPAMIVIMVVGGMVLIFLATAIGFVFKHRKSKTRSTGLIENE